MSSIQNQFHHNRYFFKSGLHEKFVVSTEIFRSLTDSYRKGCLTKFTLIVCQQRQLDYFFSRRSVLPGIASEDQESKRGLSFRTDTVCLSLFRCRFKIDFMLNSFTIELKTDGKCKRVVFPEKLMKLGS